MQRNPKEPFSDQWFVDTAETLDELAENLHEDGRAFNISSLHPLAAFFESLANELRKTAGVKE